MRSWLALSIAGLVGCGRLGFDERVASEPLTLTAPDGVNVNAHAMIGASGGAGGYTFSIVSGEGNIDEETGELVADNYGGETVVRVTDADGATADTSVVVGGSTLFVLGGWGGYTTDKVYRTTDGSAWTVGNLAISRGETRTVVFDDAMYLTGGWYSGSNIASVLRSTTGETGSWTASADLPAERGWGGAVVFHDHIFYAGGRSIANWANSDVFISNGDAWEKVGDLPSVSTWGGLAVFHDKLWYFGGDHSSEISDAIYSSIDGTSWETSAAHLPDRRAGGAILVFHDRLWYIGGVDGSGNPSDQIWTSEDGTTWTDTGARFPTVLTNPAAAVHDGKIWIIGGNDGGYLNTVFSSSDGTSWARHADLPEQLDRFSAVSFTP